MGILNKIHVQIVTSQAIVSDWYQKEKYLWVENGLYICHNFGYSIMVSRYILEIKHICVITPTTGLIVAYIISNFFMCTFSAHFTIQHWFWFSDRLLHKSHKWHTLQMRLTRLIVHLEERRRSRIGSFALLQPHNFNMSPPSHKPCAMRPCEGVYRAIVLIGNIKQAMSEGKVVKLKLD